MFLGSSSGHFIVCIFSTVFDHMWHRQLLCIVDRGAAFVGSISVMPIMCMAVVSSQCSEGRLAAIDRQGESMDYTLILLMKRRSSAPGCLGMK